MEVVGHHHPLDAQLIEELDHAQLIIKRARPFQIEADSQPSAALRGNNVFDAIDEDITVTVSIDKMTKMRQPSDVIVERRYIVANVQSDDGLSRCSAALQLRQKGVV